MVFAPGVLFAVWIVWGAALLGLAVAAWWGAADMRGLIQSVQAAYGCGPDPGLLLRADVHLHILVALTATLWLGLGCRLLAPRMLPWLPVALMVLIAMSDELAQLGSAERAFDWGDQCGDVVGMLLAFPLLLLMRRLVVGRLMLQNTATTSTPSSSRR